MYSFEQDMKIFLAQASERNVILVAKVVSAIKIESVRFVCLAKVTHFT